jgi:hypothetical protein
MTESIGETLGNPTAAMGRPGPETSLDPRPRFCPFRLRSLRENREASATLRTTARGPRLRPMLWASRASLLVVTFAPPPGAAASPAAPGALRG